MTESEPDPGLYTESGRREGNEIRRVLNGLVEQAEREARRQNRIERTWSRLGVVLGFGGALGAGVGGIGAIAGNLTGIAQYAVIVLAFAGAGLSAASGTLRAPEKAEIAESRKRRLEAYQRRIETILAVDLEIADEVGGLKAQREILEAALRAYDYIVGVEVPAPVQLSRDPSTLLKLNTADDERIAGAALPPGIAS